MGVSRVRGERNRLPVTLVVESIITKASAGSTSLSVHWEPWPRSKPRTSARDRMMFRSLRRPMSLDVRPDSLPPSQDW